ncbi:unnamed protein product [Tenebrio molitor]|nr:unnamed protein product [Tenebrio molitor]
MSRKGLSIRKEKHRCTFTTSSSPDGREGYQNGLIKLSPHQDYLEVSCFREGPITFPWDSNPALSPLPEFQPFEIAALVEFPWKMR